MPKPQPKINKSNFIRSMPDAHANDVVKAAAAKGIKLDPSFVYAIRAQDKQRTGPVGKPGRRPKGTVPAGQVAAPKAAAASGEHESAFRKLVLQTIGRVRAQEILNELASIGL
jgi:hypothetical protein